MTPRDVAVFNGPPPLDSLESFPFISSFLQDHHVSKMILPVTRESISAA